MNEDKDIDQFIFSCISACFTSRLVKKKMQFTTLLKIDKFFRLCLLSFKSLNVLFSAGNTLFSSVGKHPVGILDILDDCLRTLDASSCQSRSASASFLFSCLVVLKVGVLSDAKPSSECWESCPCQGRQTSLLRFL